MSDVLCVSTHGAVGYAPGGHGEGGVIICGQCGARIENPHPTGHDEHGRPTYGGILLGKLSQ